MLVVNGGLSDETPEMHFLQPRLREHLLITSYVL